VEAHIQRLLAGMKTVEAQECDPGRRSTQLAVLRAELDTWTGRREVMTAFDEWRAIPTPNLSDKEDFNGFFLVF
jgi:hypothetical protein